MTCFVKNDSMVNWIKLYCIINKHTKLHVQVLESHLKKFWNVTNNKLN